MSKYDVFPVGGVQAGGLSACATLPHGHCWFLPRAHTPFMAGALISA